MAFDLDQILILAASRNASDVHITTDKPPYFRVDGRIITVGQEIITQTDIENATALIFDGFQQGKLEELRDMDFVYGNKRTKRFRGNVYHTRDGLAMSFRMIPDQVPQFSQLGLPGFVLPYILSLQKGLVLVVGPTGHGKSTTLASVIKHRAETRPEHFVLLEDPIEFIIESEKSIIHQRGLGRDVTSFERGLKAALREDPNVLMVGEMRDQETIQATLTAAETGHVVFSTLHTNSAAETIHRIIDVFPSTQQQQIRLQLASTLSMVISQRLIEKINGGRSLAYEIMVSSYAIQNHIRQNSIFHIPNAMQMDNSGGMVMFEESLAFLVMDGKISYEVARSSTTFPDQLDYILETHGFEKSKNSGDFVSENPQNVEKKSEGILQAAAKTFHLTN